jgi:hypothetical protein
MEGAIEAQQNTLQAQCLCTVDLVPKSMVEIASWDE